MVSLDISTALLKPVFYTNLAVVLKAIKSIAVLLDRENPKVAADFHYSRTGGTLDRCLETKTDRINKCNHQVDKIEDPDKTLGAVVFRSTP